MKKQLLKKLSAFIVTAILFSVNANAQIVYTDVNPDLTFIQDSVGSVSHDIDINNDGTIDATITAEFWFGIDPQWGPFTGRNVMAAPSAGSELLLDPLNIFLDAKPVNYSAIIDSASQTWMPQTAFLVVDAGGATGFGQWSDTTDRYLAIRITVGGDWFYGWVRVSVDPYIISFTIRDYAYNSIPNQPILAGEGQPIITGTIENSFASSINIFPNPAIDKLTIALGSYTKKVEVTIADITGKIIYATTAGETQLIEVNTQDFAAGIYLVQIQAAGSAETRKLMITK